jgi:hypothetical protein
MGEIAVSTCPTGFTKGTTVACISTGSPSGSATTIAAAVAAIIAPGSAPGSASAAAPGSALGSAAAAAATPAWLSAILNRTPVGSLKPVSGTVPSSESVPIGPTGTQRVKVGNIVQIIGNKRGVYGHTSILVIKFIRYPSGVIEYSLTTRDRLGRMTDIPAKSATIV